MSIQTTMPIARSVAISRLQNVVDVIMAKDYKRLEEMSFEEDYLVDEFLNREFESLEWAETDVSKWTNHMIEEQIDRPFYRISMFENYTVVEDNDD